MYPPFWMHWQNCTHPCSCNTQTCMYIQTQPPHVHTQHHLHIGWIISSLYCKPGGAWQGCGDTPSGWGYSRPAVEGGGLSLFVHLSLVVYHVWYSLYTKYYTTVRRIWRTENISNGATADMDGWISCALKACSYTWWCVDVFSQEIWTEIASLGSKLLWSFCY